MNTHLRFSFYNRFPQAARLIVMCLLGFAVGCTGKSGVQLTESGWMAQRYLLFDKAYGSTDISNPDEVQRLDNTWRSIFTNGYVTTDTAGQAVINKGSSCNFYIFQTSSFGFSQETIATCSRGSTSTNCSNASTGQISNCKVSVVTLPAKITFIGTRVTITEYRTEIWEAVLIMVHEGNAIVKPFDESQAEFKIGPNKGSYAVSPNINQDIKDLFGFLPGEKVDFDQLINPIERMGQVSQIKSANILLFSQGYPIIPLPEPFGLSIRYLNEEDKFSNISEAIAQAVNWNSIMEDLFPKNVPLTFYSKGELLDLRLYPFNPRFAGALLAEAGFGPGNEMGIIYDESIRGMEEFAGNIKSEFEKNVKIVINLQPIMIDDANSVFEKMYTLDYPILVLSGN